MDPNKLSVAQFKAELKKRGLLMSGSKKDFITRLDKNDPSGKWIADIACTETSETVPDETTPSENEAVAVENDKEEDDDEERTEERDPYIYARK